MSAHFSDHPDSVAGLEAKIDQRDVRAQPLDAVRGLAAGSEPPHHEQSCLVAEELFETIEKERQAVSDGNANLRSVAHESEPWRRFAGACLA